MRVAVVALSLLLLAGCFGKDPEVTQRSFEATGGKASAGWAYDGQGLVPANAMLDGHLDGPSDTGIVNASFDLAGSRWTVVFDTFSQAEGKTFQNGGIAIDLLEHGDTGVADATIPKIHALAAAWGKATVLRDGKPAAGEAWNAHLMVSADTVRGADGKITKADGTTPYDPSAPGDARRIEGDPQVIFWIKHPQGETFQRAAEPVTAELTCEGPACVVSVELAVPDGAALLDVNLTMRGPSTPVPVGAVGQGRYVLADANGTELMSGEIEPSPAGPAVISTSVPLMGVALPLTLSLTGAGAFTVHVEGSASFNDIPFIVLTWDDVTMR